MPRDLDPSLLRAFAAVARLASFTEAAEHLNLTQGTVSQQVRRLEASLGDRVFERNHRGVRLTPFGHRALDYATRLLALHDQALDDLAGALRRPLRLGMPPDLVRGSMSAILSAFAGLMPEVDVDLRIDMSPALREAVAADELDLAVVEDRLPASGAIVLGEDALVWVGASAGRAPSVRPLRVCLVAENCAFRDTVQSALADRGLAARFVFETGDIEATTTLVRGDLAVTAWLASTVPEDLVVLDADRLGLPPLPAFGIHLHHGAGVRASATEAIARVISARLRRGVGADAEVTVRP